MLLRSPRWGSGRVQILYQERKRERHSPPEQEPARIGGEPIPRRARSLDALARDQHTNAARQEGDAQHQHGDKPDGGAVRRPF
jgi:hypothetical protein